VRDLKNESGKMKSIKKLIIYGLVILFIIIFIVAQIVGVFSIPISITAEKLAIAIIVGICSFILYSLHEESK
jgi:hypothetical protein